MSLCQNKKVIIFTLNSSLQAAHVMCLFCAVILDRIPWVAPELLDTSDNLTLQCDKWSFGATLWEIFNSGNNPLQNWDLKRVL